MPCTYKKCKELIYTAGKLACAGQLIEGAALKTKYDHTTYTLISGGGFHETSPHIINRLFHDIIQFRGHFMKRST